MRRSARTAGILSLCLAAAVAPAPRLGACGPPPPLRLLLPFAERIILVGPVTLDRHGMPTDPGGPLSEATRARLRVLETWRGEHGPYGPIPLAGDGSESGDGALLLILAKDGTGNGPSFGRIPLIHAHLRQ